MYPLRIGDDNDDVDNPLSLLDSWKKEEKEQIERNANRTETKKRKVN